MGILLPALSRHRVTFGNRHRCLLHAMYVPRRSLGRTGLEVSILGYGASPLGAVFDPNFKPENGIEAVHEAFKLGINYFDTSPFYGSGKSEEVLGRALKSLPRSEVIVSTKTGRYGPTDFNFSADRVNASIQESLKRLQLDYVDILQCHDIEFTSADQIIQETIPALIKLKESGLVRHIGITGLPLKIYPKVIDAFPPHTLDVILSYCHNTLYDNTLAEMIPYFKDHDIGVIDASPLSMGLLSPQGEQKWHPASQEIKDACKAARDLCKESGVSLPKLAVFHALQNPDVSTTLVGMQSVAEVHENVHTATLASMSPSEQFCLEEVQKKLQPVQNRTWESGLPENN